MLTAEGAALCATPSDAEQRGRRHNVNYTLRAAHRCRGLAAEGLPGEWRIIPPHYVEWALDGLH
ncbi:hypothetical protein SAMN05421579_12637 [Xenorhabdus japonica]|uniref:Uncharacterized protein n=1 Tax=Xenorhabdus japonica TaxID=53341 RepID=A0A1I5CG54_9GAMM|nr:hypothetical protein SAMN05421579_12630 [Xenorhabdus japonica]SFN86020.1 hypothetical protein SAMN05421579_12637 [Xenorhabdus japonica]